jgi:multiple sugar transport system substrate-binding protein
MTSVPPYSGQHVRHLLNRRRFLRQAAATAAVTALAPRHTRAKIAGSLRFWNLFSGGDGERLQAMMQGYRQENPGIPLEAVTFGWGAPYYTKLAMSIVGGRPPDVAALHASRLPSFAPGNLLEPLDPDVLARYDIGPDKFLPAVWESVQYDGRPYAIPLDTHPFVMYYNTAIADAAGLLDADGRLQALEGADGVIDAFARAQDVTGQLGLAYDTQDVMPWRLFSGLYAQLGGEVLSPDGRELILDDAKAIEALEFMAELTLGSRVAAPAQDYPAAVARFGNEQAGFHWNGGWEVITFQLSDLPFDVVPFPSVFGGEQTWADSHVFVVPRQAERDPERIDAALHFIAAMLSRSLTWAEGGHIPAYLPVAESDEFKAMVPQAHYAAAAENPVYDPRAWFSGAAAPLQSEAGAAFGAVLNGDSTPRQGLDQFRGAMQKLLDTPPPV